MNGHIDHLARKKLAGLARRLAAGAITSLEFENSIPHSKEHAVHELYFYGLWPLHDDFVEHRLVDQRALTPEGRAWVARIVLFLHAGLPYRYSRFTGPAQIPVLLLSLATFGCLGRFWRRRQWRGGDESVWPFYSRCEYEAALLRPVFMNGTAPLANLQR